MFYCCCFILFDANVFSNDIPNSKICQNVFYLYFKDTNICQNDTYSHFKYDVV